MQYYAINEVESKQFHTTRLVVGGGILEYKIFYAKEPLLNNNYKKMLR